MGDGKQTNQQKQNKYIYEDREQLESEYKLLSEIDTYLLHPFDATLRIVTEMKHVNKLFAEPTHIISVTITDSIIFMLNYDYV